MERSQNFRFPGNNISFQQFIIDLQVPNLIGGITQKKKDTLQGVTQGTNKLTQTRNFFLLYMLACSIFSSNFAAFTCITN